ncbi:MAG: beta-ketoacyl-[acyl-carrier-protein] synthase family protein [Rhizobiaceae bacterium]|nr:beta-ketoacyl-[acyl-carrier-protein] synthase family protein [Rhizobiaceae bacterium]
MSRQQIVVTGLGGLCALGTNAADIWDAMRNGRCGIGELDVPLLRDAKTRTGAQIRHLPEWDIDKRKLVAIDRFALLAAMAADEALRNAGLKPAEMDSRRIGAVVGTGIFGTEAADENYFALLREGKSRANVFTVPRIMPSAPAGQVSMIHGLRGPVFGVTSACASSNHAFSAAADQLRLGRADVMLAGGTDAPLVFGVVKAWEALRALARETCRPFSNDRDGLVLGEGSAILVLETYEHAKARGANILAEFAGVGLSADASDIVSPTVEGPAAAIEACLADAGMRIEDVDYINAHGTGTKANDQIETTAIRTVFGAHADTLSVSSTKSMHAHCMGASGALEAIACIMAIREGLVPPTANFRERDPDCDLDITPNVARPRKVRAAISNAFAFGGTNAVAAFRSV